MAKAPKNKVEKQEQKDQNFCLTDKKLKPLLRVFVGCQQNTRKNVQGILTNK